jgi:hypothetical protein
MIFGRKGFTIINAIAYYVVASRTMKKNMFNLKPRKCIHKARNAHQGQTLYLIWPIHKLGRLRVIISIAPGAIFKTLNFLYNLRVSSKS